MTTIDEAREKYHIIKVHAPQLDDNMRPKFKLLNPNIDNECPHDKSGHCSQCHNFMGIHSEEGSIFAHGSYEGFCDKENVISTTIPIKEEVAQQSI